MALSDWSTEQTVSPSLDSSRKHGGNSSFKLDGGVNGANFGIKRGISKQAQIIVWAYNDSGLGGQPFFGHLSYGNLTATHLTDQWEKWRATFWYDTPNNTKWGRMEYWSVDHWVQIGTDTNFGLGEPSTNSIRIGGQLAYYRMWYDDIEVYKKAI